MQSLANKQQHNKMNKDQEQTPNISTQTPLPPNPKTKHSNPHPTTFLEN